MEATTTITNGNRNALGKFCISEVNGSFVTDSTGQGFHCQN